jgi:hypothetical protein
MASISFVPAPDARGSDPSSSDKPESAVPSSPACRPSLSRLRHPAPLIALLVLLFTTAPGAAGVFDRLAGVWQAAGEDSFVRLIELGGDDRSFRLRVALVDGREWQGRFEPGPRPGLFSVSEEGGGILDWFSRRRSGQPLEGAPVDWARATADGLVVYRLDILASGRFDLLGIALTPADGTLLVRTVEHRHPTLLLRHEDRLARSGGAR